MKNYLTLVLALSIVSAPAFASRARLESLGESKGGSYYIDDSRDMFLNPAQIVHYKKKLFLELGSDTPNTLDSAASSRGQGGFTNTLGDYTYGVYLNNTSERTLAITSNALLAGAFIGPDSSVEAFWAGEGSMNWGISVFYAGNDQRAAGASEQTFSQLGARLGIDSGNLAIFSSFGIITKSTIKNDPTNPTELKGKIGIDAGITYKMDSMTAFGKYTSTGADLNAAGVTQDEIRNTNYGVGLGWKKEMTKSTNMFVRTEIDMSKAGVTTAPTNTYNLPLVLAAESQALSWLAIRGSIAESIFGQSNTGAVRNDLQGTTTVAAGLGLTFGDVQIDGLVATNGVNNPANGITGFGTGPQTNTGFGFGDNMMTRLAMTYNF